MPIRNQIVEDLKSFRRNSENYRTKPFGPVEFWPIPEADVLAAEAELGFRFPPQIRQVYLELGVGRICRDNAGRETDVYLNRVLPPEEAAYAYLEFPEDEEFLVEGELPVLDLGSGTYFVSYPASDRPDAVYRSLGGMDLVAPDYFTLLERLREDVTFYRVLWEPK